MIETLIAAGATLLVCLINNYYQQEQFENKQQKAAEETDRKHEETISMISYKLEQLTKKVDLHNNAVERLYAVETKLKVDEEKIKVVNHRIDDLEQFHKP